MKWIILFIVLVVVIPVLIALGLGFIIDTDNKESTAKALVTEIQKINLAATQNNVMKEKVKWGSVFLSFLMFSGVGFVFLMVLIQLEKIFRVENEKTNH